MEPSIIITHFNEVTFKEFMSSTRSTLGHRKRLVSFPAGTIVVMVLLADKKTGAPGGVVAVCTLANWEESKSPCRERHYLDPDVYGGSNMKYNKYEMKIENLRILKNLVTFEEIKMLVGGGPDHGMTNMWTNNQYTYIRAFVKGEDQTPLQRYRLWVKSLL
jgi:hypothetical protein